MYILPQCSDCVAESKSHIADFLVYLGARALVPSTLSVLDQRSSGLSIRYLIWASNEVLERCYRQLIVCLYCLWISKHLQVYVTKSSRETRGRERDLKRTQKKSIESTNGTFCISLSNKLSFSLPCEGSCLVQSPSHFIKSRYVCKYSDVLGKSVAVPGKEIGHSPPATGFLRPHWNPPFASPMGNLHPPQSSNSPAYCAPLAISSSSDLSQDSN